MQNNFDSTMSEMCAHELSVFQNFEIGILSTSAVFSLTENIRLIYMY